MISALVTIIIYLIILGLLVWLVFYILDAIPIPEPLNRVVRILVIVVCVLVIILLLLQLVGGAGISLPRIGG